MNYLLILCTTISNKYCAEKIARKLIKLKLAACVSIKEISSFYIWNDNIQNENEYEMTIKSKPEKLDNIIKFLKIEIGYEIPQILYNKFESEKNYYEWAEKSMN
tara:strand:+ start:118 stop:429 length:312 start_codon:yes stop_codon:yes gene_type:complete